MARKYGVEKMTMKSLWADYKLSIGFSASPSMEKWMEFFNKNITYGDPNLDSSDAFSYGRKMGLAIKNLPSKDSPHYHFESLLHGMDNLIEASWSRNAKGWWNGLTKSDKLNHLRALKPAFDYRDNSIPPSLYYQDFNSSGQQMITSYFDALQEEDPETSGHMKPTAGQYAVHGKKYNVHESKATEGVCPRCKGTGNVYKVVVLPDGDGMGAKKMECPECGGTGEISTEGSRTN